MIDVEYVSHMGDDLTVVNAARVSFGKQKDKLDEGDKKLIQYLAEHEHMSPFEHCTLSVKVKCPLYIRSQIHRHRTFSYNEISRRYTSIDLECHLPDILRKQSDSNKQASYGAVSDQANDALLIEGQELHDKCLNFYEDLLAAGVCRELARGWLPQNLMTEFWMTGNLRNWAHFVDLRSHKGAQYEAQIIALKCKDILVEKFGHSAKVLIR